jgi:cytochrome c oxidase subunit 2
MPGLRLHGRFTRAPLAGTVAVALGSCDGRQSALNTAGVGAEQVAGLFWWMLAGGTGIWLLVIGLAVYATRVSPGRHPPRLGDWLIVGGALFPAVVLALLLGFGLATMQRLQSPAGADLEIAVSGEQWWWRVRYQTPEGPVELANEVRLPVDRRAAFRLTSPDVIHSFWVPSLGGKVDMIPGRETRLTLQPTRTGRFRGTCAEYCGTAHALMSFPVVVMEPAAYASWLAHQRSPARPPVDPEARRGGEAFLANGCGACHTVRGTAADGRVGPDLTHVGSRLTLAAGTLPNGRAALTRWLTQPGAIKPGVHMPAFRMLPEAQRRAIAAYLEGLQ